MENTKGRTGQLTQGDDVAFQGETRIHIFSRYLYTIDTAGQVLCGKKGFLEENSDKMGPTRCRPCAKINKTNNRSTN